MRKLENMFNDDMVVDDDGMWSQVCVCCSEELEINRSLLSINVLKESPCGVRGCENEADYFIDFK